MKQFFLILLVTWAKGSPMDSILNSQGLFSGFSVLSETGISGVLNNDNLVSKAYSAYANQFGKSAESGKLNVFKANLMSIAQHNLQARDSGSFEMGVNQFTDMSTAEVVAKFTGYGGKSNRSSFGSLSSSGKPNKPPKAQEWKTAPASLDWRTYGMVSSVKHQGNCGSCVFFSATGCHESAHALWHDGEILDLSEQELVDCAKGRGNNGCQGGTFVPTFDYLTEQGQHSEGDYPYTAQDDGDENNSECKASSLESEASKLVGWWPVKPAADEKALKNAVASYGPVSVAIHVNDAVARYKKGVLDTTCDGGRNHAVLVVGYGTEGGKDYWLIKNSWGEGWGDKGYIKIRRNKKNMCDVAGDGVVVNA